MFKTNKFYFKLYLVFIVVILLITLVFHLITLKSQSPPHVQHFETIMRVVDLVQNHKEAKDLKSRIDEEASKTRTYITVFNNKGEQVASSQDKEGILDEKIIDRVNNQGIYFNNYILKGLTVYVVPFHRDGNLLGYIEIEKKAAFLIPPRFLIHSLFICIVMIILAYPLALYVTNPVNKIIKKASRLSQRDFSALDDEEEIKGNDEFAELNRAFNGMAKELVSMVEERKELISDISHELGAPLSRMKVAMETIENKLEKGKPLSLKTLERLSKNIGEMSELVKELLDFSRMDRLYSLNPVNFNPEEVARDLIDKFQVIMNKKNIKVNLECKPENMEITADKDKIRRVMQNLIANSLRYSVPDSSIEIKLRKESDKFIFSIKDQGPGIALENKSKIFEPFYREDTSRSRNTGGAGLGLAIVSKLISLHKGKIWVENPGEPGAKISFII